MAISLDKIIKGKPKDYKPTIYAYEHIGVEKTKGYIKVGYTTRSTEIRVGEQTRTTKVPKKIIGTWPALRDDGTSFRDADVHRILESKGFRQLDYDKENNDWYECELKDVEAAVVALQTGTENIENRTQTFKMRDEQKEAVDQTFAYYYSALEENPNKAPKYLWNAKMRFGKTFAAYQLAKKLNAKRVLVLTFKPAVKSAWKEDLLQHVDFDGWQFISREADNKVKIDEQYENADLERPIVCFGSFQDFLGYNKETKGIKTQHQWVHDITWDLVIFDEYHYGAWRENAKKLFEKEDEEDSYNFDQEEYKKDEADDALNETWLPITTKHYLFLSGTPFRALNSGEFIEEQIYNWTYSDEQEMKEKHKDNPNSPYAALPKMIMMTYQLPDAIKSIAMQGEFNEFDLNVFFKAEGKGDDAKFVYEDYVQKWLDLIRGAYLPTSTDNLKLGNNETPPMPFMDTKLLDALTHTLWFLPDVASCYAMANLLKKKQNVFYHDYKINVCAGSKAGIGVEALKPVKASMHEPLESKTITLSCGKLTTGVTIRPWTGIFMLRNLNSPETYFQAAFRVQSPWEVHDDNNNRKIIKNECFVFDFALNRALRQISEYSHKLFVGNDKSPEEKVGEFIKFLPVLAYEGSVMKEINAKEILDITMSGTTATLLARRWQSALLVNVDNETLNKLLANKKAMDVLMKIEGFRNLNQDIETIINKSEAVKKARKEGETLTPKEKKQLTEEEKEYKSKRKQIQEKLIKFATRVPIFMYLTDYREQTLKDVITKLEPELFKRVTGLSVDDFNLLLELNLFNGNVMNQAIYNFKRYEDNSLEYAGINKHEGEDVGGWDVSISAEEYRKLYKIQHDTTEIFNDEIEKDIFKATQIKSEKSNGFEETKNLNTIKDETVKKDSNKIDEIDNAPIEETTVKVPKVKIGMMVEHNKFGKGSITAIDGNHIVVEFKNGGEKKFGYPDVFINGFLK